VRGAEARLAVLPQVEGQKSAHRHHAEQRVQPAQEEMTVADGAGHGLIAAGWGFGWLGMGPIGGDAAVPISPAQP